MSTTVTACWLLVLAAIAWISPVDNARILAVETIAGHSHWNFMSSMLRALTDAGHTVIAFTPLPDGDRTNYSEVDMSSDYQVVSDLKLTTLIERFGRASSLANRMIPISRFYCDIVRRRIDEWLSGGRPDIDAIVMEPLSTDCMSYIANRLDAPILYAIPSPMITSCEHKFTGHYANPAIVTHFQSKFAVLETFARRIENVALWAYVEVIIRFNDLVLRLTDPKPYDSLSKVSPSVIFQNSHYVTETSRPVSPNHIFVGGVHLKPPKIIPEKILKFIEDSPQGVIYFTFGSTVNMSTLPSHVENAFKEALAQVPQKVLWRYDGEMKDKPKNVMTQKWFPQREILLHPKVKLFISHGGISGLYESVDAGVPVLGFPLFYDQPRNVAHLVYNGNGMYMDLFTVTKETLFGAISDIINNPKYAKNAKKASALFKDRPISPEKSVVYWTEYVIRHRGASHLESHALNLTWYQYFLLDVIAAILICFCLIVFLSYAVLKCICNRVLGRSKTNKIKTQ